MAETVLDEDSSLQGFFAEVGEVERGNEVTRSLLLSLPPLISFLCRSLSLSISLYLSLGLYIRTSWLSNSAVDDRRIVSCFHVFVI